LHPLPLSAELKKKKGLSNTAVTMLMGNSVETTTMRTNKPTQTDPANHLSGISRVIFAVRLIRGRCHTQASSRRKHITCLLSNNNNFQIKIIFVKIRLKVQDFRFPSFPRRQESSNPLKKLDTRIRGYDEFKGLAKVLKLNKVVTTY